MVPSQGVLHAQKKLEEKRDKTKDNWKRIIDIDTGTISVLQFDLGNEDLNSMFNSGFRAAARFFEVSELDANLVLIDDFKDFDTKAFELGREDIEKINEIKAIQKNQLTFMDLIVYWSNFVVNKVSNID